MSNEKKLFNRIIPGDNAEPTQNSQGENIMDIQYTEDELQSIKELEQVQLTSKKKDGSPEEIPAGSYLASITKASRAIHEEGRYDIIKMEIKIQAEPYSGHVLNKVYHQKVKKVIDFFKREMKEIGHEISSRDELDDLCKNVVGTIVVADVVPNDSGNQLIYLKNANTKKAVTPVDPDSLW